MRHAPRPSWSLRSNLRSHRARRILKRRRKLPARSAQKSLLGATAGGESDTGPCKRPASSSSCCAVAESNPPCLSSRCSVSVDTLLGAAHSVSMICERSWAVVNSAPRFAFFGAHGASSKPSLVSSASMLYLLSSVESARSGEVRPSSSWTRCSAALAAPDEWEVASVSAPSLVTDQGTR
eukprot:CAMPEP_0119503538 /NCGR_PEP_ID=MMETSP1344-20130328/24676_1 /TAXON_ID=236787 /ORGANISM="Florenciella parvula, Strain CCMP2471" /LENGTH=179 /DNA_ID=CAMNT_0007539839 /DNA_START=8 /DNA_END=547 /DNA_ORIENTATION=+